MQGRTTKPTALKVIEGNKGKRGINKQEPDPEYLVDLTPPAWLSEDAKRVWDEVAPNLSKAKLLTCVDVELLAQGCVGIANFRKAHAMASGDQMISAGLTGKYVNPWLVVQSMSFKQSMKVFEQFGMSPAARTRIAIQPQGDLFGDTTKGKNYFS